MADLITIATFNEPIEANLARIQLESEGIPAYLADEATVGIAWHLGTAIGGVKLQVSEDDAQRALSVLEEKTPIVSSDHELAANETAMQSEVKPGVTDPTEELVTRALRSAVLGLLFLPLQIYSLWLLCRIGLNHRPLSTTHWKRVILSWICNLPILITCLFIIWATFFRPDDPVPPYLLDGAPLERIEFR